MSKLIEELCSDEKLVFAHCVSADLSDSRNMSAGVAQLFKKRFRKPQNLDWDC